MRAIRTDEYVYIRRFRTDEYVYIRRFNNPPAFDPHNCDDSPSKSLWLREGWFERPVPGEELYHTRLDPQERRNLAHMNYYASVKKDLYRRLNEWMKRSGDVLSPGPTPEWTIRSSDVLQPLPVPVVVLRQASPATLLNAISRCSCASNPGAI